MDPLVLDQLNMLVTSDPVAELDGVLARTAARLRAARATGDAEVAERLAAWLDALLDQRLEFDLGTTRPPNAADNPGCVDAGRHHRP